MTSLPLRALDLLAKEISSALASRTDASIDGLLDAAHRLRDRADLLADHLRVLVSDPEQLADATRRAYKHVNGFIKIKLFSDEHFCLRLHIWPAGDDRRGDTEPHSHRWHFVSWVAVGGGLRETYFEEATTDDPRGDEHVKYEYGRRETGDGVLRPCGRRVQLRSYESHYHRSGTVYECSNDTVHTIAPDGEGLIATVVLQGPKVTDTTAVNRPANHIEFPVLEETVDPEELAALFDAVEAAIVGAIEDRPFV